MSICGKGNLPGCHFFTTGGCVSPFNCIHKIKLDFHTGATSNATENRENAEIARLTAENAELRERLEKAVELPCRVGDTVYEKGMYEGDVYEHRISKIIFDAEKISFDCTAIGNSIFLTREAAEARLKELKEMNND